MKTQLIQIRVPIESPSKGVLRKVINFRRGQKDRKDGNPCASVNGAYLDGWYSPEEECPPYVTEAHMKAFNL